MLNVYNVMNTSWIVFKNLLKTTISCLVKLLFFCNIVSIKRFNSYLGLLWSKDAPQFGVSTNGIFLIFMNNYLTIDQTIFKNEICNAQIHQHNEHVKKMSIDL